MGLSHFTYKQKRYIKYRQRRSTTVDRGYDNVALIITILNSYFIKTSVMNPKKPNVNNMKSRLSASLIMTLSTVLLCQSTAHAQNDVAERLVPIISLILDDENDEGSEPEELDCPVVTSETTLSGVGGVEINNQSDVDEFIGITRIEAVLNFGFGPDDTDIDLSPFDSLVEATGNFNMRGSGPVNLVGFDCLRTIGGNFNIDGPSATEIISGFSSLESIGNQFAISNSASLISVNGFSSLETIGTFFQVAGNSNLTSISGFESLISTNQFFQIDRNVNLTSVSGFNSLVSGGTFVQFDPSIVECNSSNQASLLCQ